jgi:hypothetical protein
MNIVSQWSYSNLAKSPIAKQEHVYLLIQKLVVQLENYFRHEVAIHAGNHDANSTVLMTYTRICT